MAYIFIDDQTPEASEYESNYVFFNEDDLDSMVEALARVRLMERRSPRPLTGEIALLERAIARRRRTLTNDRESENRNQSRLGFILGWTSRTKAS